MLSDANRSELRRRSVLLFRAAAVGLVGGSVANALGVPLAWMLGPLVATAIASLCGLRTAVPKQLRAAARGCVGVLLGSALDQEILARAPQWPLSIAALVLGMLAAVTLVAVYYRAIARFDPITAVASSIPGGISSVSVIAIQLGADPQRTVVSQLMRITLVLLTVPPLYAVWQAVGTAPAEVTPADGALLPFGQNMWVLLLAPVAWFVAKLARLPVPEMLGPMVMAAALSLSGIPIALPGWLFALTFLVLGSAIGSRFHGLTAREFLFLGGHGIVATGILFAGAFGVALLIRWATGVPLPVALLSVIPGGIAEMALLATALGIDPVFVTFHQVVRNICINTLSPFVLNWLRKRAEAA